MSRGGKPWNPGSASCGWAWSAAARGAFIGGGAPHGRHARPAGGTRGRLLLARPGEHQARPAAELYLDPARCYPNFEAMADGGGGAAGRGASISSASSRPTSRISPSPKAFLEAGFHVVCDKPMTYNAGRGRGAGAARGADGARLRGDPQLHRPSPGPSRPRAVPLGRDGDDPQGHRRVPAGFPHGPAREARAEAGRLAGRSGPGRHRRHAWATSAAIASTCSNTSPATRSSRSVPTRARSCPTARSMRTSTCCCASRAAARACSRISQVATGEENGLTLRVYGSKGAINWDQENPNYLELYRYGEPRQTLTRGQGYLSEPAKACDPHPDRPSRGLSRSLRHDLLPASSGPSAAHIDGKPLTAERVRIPDRL